MNNEPVAWIAYDEFGDFMLEATPEGDYPWQPLYTTPQIKELSDEDIREVIRKHWNRELGNRGMLALCKAVLEKASTKCG